MSSDVNDNSLNPQTTVWLIRPAIPSDIPFIYSTWLKSFKYDSALGKSMRKSVFFESYREVIDNILDQSSVAVACMQDDPNVIIGYAVYEAYSMFDCNILHYAFVKESFRGLKVATSLLRIIDNKKPTKYTHLTSKFKLLTCNSLLFASFIYNPFLLYKDGK